MALDFVKKMQNKALVAKADKVIPDLVQHIQGLAHAAKTAGDAMKPISNQLKEALDANGGQKVPADMVPGVKAMLKKYTPMPAKVMAKKEDVTAAMAQSKDFFSGKKNLEEVLSTKEMIAETYLPYSMGVVEKADPETIDDKADAILDALKVLADYGVKFTHMSMEVDAQNIPKAVVEFDVFEYGAKSALTLALDKYLHPESKF